MNKSTDEQCGLPAVSIGLPVHNGEAFLGQAIDSLLGQSFGDFELIISDNASTDGTESICRSFVAADNRIRYDRLESNVGAAKNFNRTFEMSHGRYFKWAAHDDLCEPTFLERCIEVLENRPDVVVAHTDTAGIDETGTIRGYHNPAIDKSFESDGPHHRFSELINIPHFCLSIFGVIRSDMLRLTPLIGAFVGSDRVLLTELGLHGKIHVVRAPLFKRRDHENASVRRYRADPYAWRTWFDPALDGVAYFPTKVLADEYAKAIERAPLTGKERRRCHRVLDKWCREGLDHEGRKITDLLAADEVAAEKRHVDADSQPSDRNAIAGTGSG